MAGRFLMFPLTVIGGKGWGGGQYPRAHNNQEGTAPPLDSADALYKAHDLCWDAASTAGRKKQCGC
jgi:hypothetical protein